MKNKGANMSKEPKWKSFGITMDYETLIRLDRLAKQDNRGNRSAQIEDIVKGYLKDNDNEFINKHKDYCKEGKG